MKLTPKQCVAIDERYTNGNYGVMLGFQETVCADCGATMHPLEPQGSRGISGNRFASVMICIACLREAVTADIVA